MSIVTIALPKYPSSGRDIPLFFKQLELCVHHARKAYEVQIQNASESSVREDDFVKYETPSIDLFIKTDLNATIDNLEGNMFSKEQKMILKDKLSFLHSDDFLYELRENIEIEINVN